MIFKEYIVYFFNVPCVLFKGTVVKFFLKHSGLFLKVQCEVFDCTMKGNIPPNLALAQ